MSRRQVDPCRDSVGTCVVFNCMNFNDEKDKREGTQFDGAKIRETFFTFNCAVVTIDDPTKEDVEGEITKIKQGSIEPYKDLMNKEFFICFILSHGTDSYSITTSGNSSINLKDTVIEELHKVTALKGKNKIIIQQTCRGKLTDEGEIEGNQMVQKNMLSEYEPVTPITSHPYFFIMCSSTPGYMSYRCDKGTTFIHMFCDLLQEYRSELSLSELVQRLIFTISCIPVQVKVKNVGYKCFFQIPNIFSTLRSPLLLHHDKTVKDNRPKDYKIKDVYANTERKEIISYLHTLSNDGVCIPHYSEEEPSDYLLLAKQTPGSYDMHLENGVNYYLVIDIREDKLTNKQAQTDLKIIENTMKSLNFVGNVVDRPTKKEEINVNNCMPKNQKISTFLCFIQLDEDQNEDIKEIMSHLKGQKTLLDKPKVFIVQPYVPRNKTVTDGFNPLGSNGNPNPHPVKVSKESDVLIIYSSQATYVKRSLTEMFCKTILSRPCSVIDLLEDVLPKVWKKQWDAVKPSFSSTMRKHLVLNPVPEEKDYEESHDPELLKRLKMFKDKIILADSNASASISDRIQIPNVIELQDFNTKSDGLQPFSHRNMPDVRTRADGILPSRQNTRETAWTDLPMVCGSIMLTVGILIVILSSIKIGLGVVGHTNTQNCDPNHNLTLNDSLLCEHSTRVTTLAIDITSLTTNVLITIVGLVVLISVKRNIIFIGNLHDIPMTYRVSVVLCFAFSIISCILEIVRIIVSKSNSFYSKDETALSVSIVIVFAVLWIFPIVVVQRSRKQDSCSKSCCA